MSKLNSSSQNLSSIPSFPENAQTINLDDNEIARIENLSAHTNLQQLSICRNKLTHLIGMNTLVNICVLNLANNSIKKIDGIRNLSKLTWLNLANNQISAIENIQANTQLRHLDLSGNLIGPSITNQPILMGLTRLKTLLLHSNQICTLRMHMRMDSRHHQTTHADCADTLDVNWTGQKSISADRNQFNQHAHTQAHKLIQLPASIQIFSLAENNLCDLTEIGYLSQLQSLEQLSIMNNPCVEHLKRYCEYRPFVVNWCLNLRILDGREITRKESLQAEWLYSQGGARHFRPGQHAELIAYLHKTCPIIEPSSNSQTTPAALQGDSQSASNASSNESLSLEIVESSSVSSSQATNSSNHNHKQSEEKLERILNHQKRHQQNLRANKQSENNKNSGVAGKFPSATSENTAPSEAVKLLKDGVGRIGLIQKKIHESSPARPASLYEEKYEAETVKTWTDNFNPNRRQRIDQSHLAKERIQNSELNSSKNLKKKMQKHNDELNFSSTNQSLLQSESVYLPCSPSKLQQPKDYDDNEKNEITIEEIALDETLKSDFLHSKLQTSKSFYEKNFQNFEASSNSNSQTSHHSIKSITLLQESESKGINENKQLHQQVNSSLENKYESSSITSAENSESKNTFQSTISYSSPKSSREELIRRQKQTASKKINQNKKSFLVNEIRENPQAAISKWSEYRRIFETSAQKIQACWRGYRTRNLDQKIRSFLQDRRLIETQKQLIDLQKQMLLYQRSYEQERRVNSLQNEAIKMLMEEMEKIKSWRTETDQFVNELSRTVEHNQIKLIASVSSAASPETINKKFQEIPSSCKQNGLTENYNVKVQSANQNMNYVEKANLENNIEESLCYEDNNEDEQNTGVEISEWDDVIDKNQINDDHQNDVTLIEGNEDVYDDESSCLRQVREAAMKVLSPGNTHDDSSMINELKADNSNESIETCSDDENEKLKLTVLIGNNNVI